MKRLLILTAVISALLLSCTTEDFVFNSDDNHYGDNVYVFDDAVADYDSSLVLGKQVSAGEGPYILLGESEQAKCSILLQFIGLPEDMTVHSSWITLATKSVIGESGGMFSGTLHAVDSSWTESALPDITYGPALSSFTITGDSTVHDSIPVPAELIQHWIDTNIDSLNHGLILIPDNAGFAKQYYARQNESVTSLNVNYTVEDTIQTREYSSNEDSYLTEIKADINSELYVTNYLPHELILRFNLEDIAERSSINKAELVLHVDLSQSLIGVEDYAFSVSEITNESWTVDSLTVNTALTGIGVMDDVTGELRVPVTDLVQAWVSMDERPDGELLHPNFGIILTSGLSKSDLSTFIVRTGDLSPKIYVSYTEFKPVK